MPESESITDSPLKEEELTEEPQEVIDDPDLSTVPSSSEESETQSELQLEDLDDIKDAAAALDLSVYVLTNDENKYFVVGRISPDNGSYEYLDLEENKFLPLPLSFEGVKDINTLKTREDIEVMVKELDELQQIIMDLDMEVFIDE